VTCEVQKLDGVIRIRGDMTIYNAALVKDALFAALQGVTDVRIDLSGVSEVDTTGLQVLLMAHRVCASGGVPFAIADLSDAMREVLGLLRLDTLAQPVRLEVAQ
jgi:anti-anti-sigma factor